MNKYVKGDSVVITSGKDKGQKGEVAKVLSGASAVVVQGFNLYKKHVRRSANQSGSIREVERPIPVGNVMVVCKNCQKPTRVGFKLEGKTKKRICKKCGGEL